MKTELRERYRARRREFVAAHGAQAASPANAHLRRLIGDLDPGARAAVCGYRALPEEVALDVDAGWYLPRIDGDQLEFRRPSAPTDLALNQFGIAEPVPARSTPLDFDQTVITCCPAVAVDWRGGRLGMGKSYYDRFFARRDRCVRIGVVYHVQVSEDRLPADSWDQPLDWIVTDKMILRTSQRSLRQWT